MSYVSELLQQPLFDWSDEKESEWVYQKVNQNLSHRSKAKSGYFQLCNRRYLGNKYRLLDFIENITSQKCGSISSICDIFAGTGAVSERFNQRGTKVIANDFLSANYVSLQSFLGVTKDISKIITEKIIYLNSLQDNTPNYFSEHFGGTYFSLENAIKIGNIREEIERIASDEQEKNLLLCSLIYATDKVANTVGHYDAFRKKLDAFKPLKLLFPNFDYSHNTDNEIYQEDANKLIRKVSADVLYIDPPYNSRQYSDAYHLLENLTEWKKPSVSGIGKKMDRTHIKSDYCLNRAEQAFTDLIDHAQCKHILLSYNNTGCSKDGRSNARITDEAIMHILNRKGRVEIFERDYRLFTTGKSNSTGNIERVFYCSVTK